MKKISLSVVLGLLVSTPTIAGGYLTNTNQSAAFLRNPARDAAIGIDGAYSNPAGINFMSEGWHIALNIQGAFQTRTATSTFAPFALGKGNSADGVKEFKGEAQAPVVPSLQLAYVGKRWSFSLSGGVTGGGGKCTFDDGLGSFESQVAMIPVLVNGLAGQNAVTGYSANSYMHGRQYYIGLQAGAGYRFLDNLSGYAGIRLVRADCNYYGYVEDISLRLPDGNYYPAADVLTQAGYGQFAPFVADRRLDCNQSGWGFTPVLGIDWKAGRLNLAAKYEFKTRLRLKNQSNNTSGVADYDDGLELAADVPAILTLGAQYDVLNNLRVSAGFHYYFDKQATQHGHKEQYLKSGGKEFLAGVEYDITKRVTASIGAQHTSYGLGSNSKFLSDISFVTNSTSLGLGVNVKVTDRLHLDVAYFKTFYHGYTKEMDDYNGIKDNFKQLLTAAGAEALAPVLDAVDTRGTDRFKRTNDVVGIGINFDF